MKILLIQPFPYMIPVENRYSDRIPLGILYIGSTLKDRIGVDVEILDLSIKDTSFNFDEFINKGKFDVVGISIHSTSIAPLSFFLSKKMRHHSPETIIIAGGVHATAEPISTLKLSEIDIIVIGEGEEITCELIKVLSSKKKDLDKVAGIYYKKNNLICNTGKGTLPDINKLPHMPTNLINIENYNLNVPHLPIGKTINLITSRGCPYKCAFCSYQNRPGRKIRTKKVNNLVMEIENIISNFNINNFYFVDDNFLFSYNRILQLKKILQKKDIKIFWKCQTRGDYTKRNKKFSEIIAETGCKQVSIGIESGDQNVLDKLGKNIKLKDAKIAIKSLKDNGIAVRLFLMVGLPYQTKNSISKTLEFINETKPDEIAVNLFTPFPGSEIYKKLNFWGVEFVSNDIKKHLYRIDWFDKKAINNIQPVIRTKWMSECEILEAKNLLISEFETIIGSKNIT